MCKLLIMTAIQDSKLAYEFMGRMAKPMSYSNRDGIGYTAVKSNGDLFSERWLNNENFFDPNNVMTPEIAKKLAKYKKNLPPGALDQSYGTYGELDFEDIRSVTMHTRMATCEKNFANVHPFIDKDEAGNDFSLVHNGVIRNAFTSHYSKGLDVNKVSTCDSEAALQTYMSNGVLNDPSQAKKWLDLLTGSWAFGILGLNNGGTRVLDVVRGSSFLYYMEAGPLGKIFTTNDDDAIGVLKDMGIEITGKGGMVNSNTMYRYDAVTGEVIGSIDIKPVYNYSNTGHSGSSYYQGGGTTTSRSSTPKETASTEADLKNKEYNEAILKNAMGDDTALPDVLDSKGRVDYGKAAKWYNNTNNTIAKRLALWDELFNDIMLDLYMGCTEMEKSFVDECDASFGFKEARRMLSQIDEGEFKQG